MHKVIVHEQSHCHLTTYYCYHLYQLDAHAWFSARCTFEVQCTSTNSRPFSQHTCEALLLLLSSTDCTAWLDWCHTGWQCGTQYDEALYRAGPPPPCPPPRDNSLPLQPGRCAFDLNLGTCRWFGKLVMCIVVVI